MRFLFHVLSVELVDVNNFVDFEDVVDTKGGEASSCMWNGRSCLTCDKFRLQYFREFWLFFLFLFFFLVF